MRRIWKLLGGGILAVSYKLRWTLRAGRAGREEVGKILELELDEYHYARYFYAFVKAFSLEGYTVVLRSPPEILLSLSRAQYGGLILDDLLVRYEVTMRPKGSFLKFGRDGLPKRIEPSDLPDPEARDSVHGVYEVPMAQHPNMYKLGYWNASIDGGMEDPLKSVLFVGNCDEGIYQRIEEERSFAVVGRTRILKALRCAEKFREICDPADLYKEEPGTINVLRTDQVSIEQEKFRQILSRYRFFLCAPGAFMPLCHNLVEALSVGAIPIIQDEYVKLLSPPLRDLIDAFVFHGEGDLLETIKTACDAPDYQLSEMAVRVRAYYENNLSPSAVVRNCEAPEVKEIRLLAGKLSMDLRGERLGL